jgi:hypothetical protein
MAVLFFISGLNLSAAALTGLIRHLIGLAGFALLGLLGRVALLGVILLIWLAILLCHTNFSLSAGASFDFHNGC